MKSFLLLFWDMIKLPLTGKHITWILLLHRIEASNGWWSIRNACNVPCKPPRPNLSKPLLNVGLQPIHLGGIRQPGFKQEMRILGENAQKMRTGTNAKKCTFFFGKNTNDVRNLREKKRKNHAIKKQYPKSYQNYHQIYKKYGDKKWIVRKMPVSKISKFEKRAKKFQKKVKKWVKNG